MARMALDRMALEWHFRDPNGTFAQPAVEAARDDGQQSLHGTRWQRSCASSVGIPTTCGAVRHWPAEVERLRGVPTDEGACMGQEHALDRRVGLGTGRGQAEVDERWFRSPLEQAGGSHRPHEAAGWAQYRKSVRRPMSRMNRYRQFKNSEAVVRISRAVVNREAIT